MNRRGFLGSILAAAAAPAIVRADSLMRIVPRELVVLGYPRTATEIRASCADWAKRLGEGLNDRQTALLMANLNRGLGITRELVAYGVIRRAA